MSEKLLTMETAHARATDPSTSSLAAETVNVNRHQGWVLWAARRMKTLSAPFTDEDLVAYLHMHGVALSPQSVRSRRAVEALDRAKTEDEWQAIVDRRRAS